MTVYLSGGTPPCYLKGRCAETPVLLFRQEEEKNQEIALEALSAGAASEIDNILITSLPLPVRVKQCFVIRKELGSLRQDGAARRGRQRWLGLWIAIEMERLLKGIEIKRAKSLKMVLKSGRKGAGGVSECRQGQIQGELITEME